MSPRRIVYRSAMEFFTKKISSTVKVFLVMVLICDVNSIEGAPPDSPTTAKEICPDQCVCSPEEMLCSGGNFTDVLNHGIHFQVLHLDFSNTSMDLIPPEVTFMSNCKKLNLSSNNIQTIDKFSLQNLWNLEELVLSNNSIKEMAAINPSVLFYNNKIMRVLNLSNNPLADLGRDLNTMLYSESLQVLDVSKCRITSLVGPMVLSGLKNLTYLNLSDNPLIRLGGLLSNTLKVLNLRGCQLNYLSVGALSGFRNLEILDTSLNEQLYMDDAVLSSTLKSLDMSKCSVRTPNLLGMTELRHAFLNGNRIRRLTAYQFVNNTKLNTLDLSKNDVETVDPLAFYGMSSLRHLDLSANAIKDGTWESSIVPLSVLETLLLSRNPVAGIYALRSVSLRRLDLSYCQIEYVPNDAFVGLDRLAELVLANNPLQMLLPGSLNSTALSTLDLSYCRISHLVSYEFVNVPNVVEIRLTGNRLVTLKNGTFAKCPRLQRVYLDDNPWRCDCNSVDFAYMVAMANKTDGQSSSVDRNPRCSSPENVTRIPWTVACANGSAYGRDNRKNFSMAVGVILILCVSGLMAIFVAVHENIKTRQAMRRRRQMDVYGDPERGADMDEYFDEYAAAADAVRKLSQLPSYDEAVMLPRPAGTPSSHRTSKRNSCTQTDEAEEAEAAAAAEAVAVATDRYRSSAGRGRGRGVGGDGDGRLLAPPGLHVTQL